MTHLPSCKNRSVIVTNVGLDAQRVLLHERVRERCEGCGQTQETVVNQVKWVEPKDGSRISQRPWRQRA